jgi:long-chain acyl-CoA synthetase
LFWSENSPEWIVAFYGCLLRGAVVVPLDLKSAPDFAARVQQQVAAKLLLADESQPQLDVPVCH